MAHCTPPASSSLSTPAMPAIPTLPPPPCDEAEAILSDVGSYDTWLALARQLKSREIGANRTAARRGQK